VPLDDAPRVMSDAEREAYSCLLGGKGAGCRAPPESLLEAR